MHDLAILKKLNNEEVARHKREALFEQTNEVVRAHQATARAKVAHDEAGRKLKAELDALAHKIADAATHGGEDYEAVMEYEITREAIKLHEAKNVAV
jgi:hypothetical protein